MNGSRRGDGRTTGRLGGMDVDRLVRVVWSVPRLLLVLVVRAYQLVVSPLLGPTCRYYPSCSAYGVQALTRHGVLWGTWLTVRRLLRCHPWAAGGVDDVPEQGWCAPGARSRWGGRVGSPNAEEPTGSLRTVAGSTPPERVNGRDTLALAVGGMVTEAARPGGGAPQRARVGGPRGRHAHHRSCGAEHPAPVN